MTSLKARREQFLSDPNIPCLNNWIGLGLLFFVIFSCSKCQWQAEAGCYAV